MKSESGIVHILGLLVALAAIGVVSFLLVSSSAPFKNKLFSALFPKPASHASENNLVDKDLQNLPDLIPDQYIVVLKDKDDKGEKVDPEKEANNAEKNQGVKKLHIYRHALNGYSFKGNSDQAGKLKNDPHVKSVTQDRQVHIAQITSPTASPSSLPCLPYNVAGQILPTGIDRIDADCNPSSRINGVDERVNVNVAVIDTGIDDTHPDLNVKGGVNCNDSSGWNPPYRDGDGHGTHVAGTIGALDNGVGVVGVAPGANLYGVRVLNNSGTGNWSNVICGIDWVTGTRDPNDGDPTNDIAVANMSLSGSGIDDGNCGLGNPGANPPILPDPAHQAICNSVAAGVVYVVAAGNANTDASYYAPSAYDEVITVSAINDTDGKPGHLGSPTQLYGPDDALSLYSDYGADVDIAAPGSDILSTCFIWAGSQYPPYCTKSGTSMAAPHVTGAVALYIANNGIAHNATEVANIRSAITDPTNGYSVAQNSSLGFSGDKDNYHEPLLFVGNAPGNPPSPVPSGSPTPIPSSSPTASPSLTPTPSPTAVPSPTPTAVPTPTPAPVHDVAVTDSHPASYTIKAGDSVLISTTMADLGTFNESTTHTLTDTTEGKTIISYSVSLGAGNSTNHFNSWITTPSTFGGDHVIRDEVSSVDGETNLINNVKTFTITVTTIPDTTPPTSPTNLFAIAISTSQINLDWTPATDNVVVTSYDIYRDNVKLTNINASFSCISTACSFGDTDLAAGSTHSYSVIARDAANNQSPASNTVTATTQPLPTPTPNPTLPPPSSTPSTLTVSFTQPSNNGIVPANTNILLKADASDTSSKISKVEFFYGNTRKCSDNSTPYSCSWNPGNPGLQYTLTTKAYNLLGKTVSSAITVISGKDITTPTTNITSPINGVIVTRGTGVVVYTKASDEVGVSSMELDVNGARICSDSSVDLNGYYSCKWNVPSFPNTSYTLTTKASDYAKNVGVSSGITVRSSP